MFVLEKHHRIVATDGSPQKPGRVGGRGRKRDADAGAVGEDALAGLAVVRPALDITPDGDAHDHRAGEIVARPIAKHRHLVAQLHHRRPDVIEELYFHYRLQVADGHSDCPPDDGRLGERGIEDAVVAKQPLQAVRELEHPALAEHDLERFMPARIRHVFSEHDNPGIARHLVLESVVDGGNHRVGLPLGLRGRVERV